MSRNAKSTLAGGSESRRRPLVTPAAPHQPPHADPCVEQPQGRPIGKRSLTWQQPDLPGERGPVVVDGVADNVGAVDLEHVDAPDLHAPAARVNALERTAVERPG